jgi:hypothetical protein
MGISRIILPGVLLDRLLPTSRMMRHGPSMHRTTIQEQLEVPLYLI